MVIFKSGQLYLQHKFLCSNMVLYYQLIPQISLEYNKVGGLNILFCS